jgi:hypothetical protein
MQESANRNHLLSLGIPVAAIIAAILVFALVLARNVSASPDNVQTITLVGYSALLGPPEMPISFA